VEILMGTKFIKYIINKLFLKPKMVVLLVIFNYFTLTSNIWASEQKSYHQLQAEILVNFVKYIEWKDRSIPKRKICIIEDDPIITYLINIIRNDKNLEYLIKYENDYLDECHIVYVGDNYEGYLNRLVSRLKHKSILSISGQKNFVESGGIVQFLLRNNRVEFIINDRQMKLSTLKIHNSILEHSEIYK